MCGVIGRFSLGSPITEREIDEVRSGQMVIRHRGPDQNGLFSDSHCVLGNDRLSIMDPREQADLPMSSHDGRVHISYNGEVSNFIELREKYRLTEKYPMKTNSDTEVLIYLYIELGIDFIQELSGMFAFALYDQKLEKAFIVRDFFGINPLFIFEKGDRLCFSSELKGFFEFSDFRPTLNAEAMYHYFSMAYIPDRLTPYNEAWELMGGRLLEIDLKSKVWQEREYYQMKYETDYSISEKQATEDVHELMRDSVRRNLLSDKPLGTTLSGGIDTSTILSLVKELGQSKGFQTYSIRMGESSFDESKYQRIMAEFAGSEHHEITVHPEDVMDALVPHMAFLDEPNGDGSAIPSFILAREAKKKCDVLLSGEGGDEIFNAYETHGAFKYRQLYRKMAPKPFRKLFASAVQNLPSSYGKLSLDFMLKRFTEGVELPTAEAHMYWRHPITEDEKRRLFKGRVPEKRSEKFFTELFENCGLKDDLNKISLIDIRYFFIGDLMVKNDRMFMAHSIETRFPFMDRLLTEYVEKLPPNLRIKGLQRRYIQKKAMEGYMPKKVLNRSNFGLEMPHSIWFLDKMQPLLESYLTRERIERTEILDYETVRGFWEAHKAGRRDYGRGLWCILLFVIWFELFLYNGDYKKYLQPN